MKLFITLFSFFSISISVFAQVGIGTTTPDESAVLELESTNKGFLPPRMTANERDNISNPALGLVLFCTDCAMGEGELQVYHTSGWKNSIGGEVGDPLEIGDFYEGGVIFYIAHTPADLNGDGNLNHGLVCAVEDQSVDIQWNNGSNITTGATGVNIGTGATNTNTIINVQGATETDYAAGSAANYNGGGYNDWYLPSWHELEEMYLNRATIDATATANSGNGFANDFYWSSTETANNSAILINFSSSFSTNSGKFSEDRVRAIRAF